MAHTHNKGYLGPAYRVYNWSGVYQRITGIPKPLTDTLPQPSEEYFI
jgi:hypothetical protein